MKNVVALLIAALVSSCGFHAPDPRIFGPQWDLAKPIYVDADASMPKREIALTALRNALSMTGVTISQDPSTEQQIYLEDSVDSDCAKPGILAYDHLGDMAKHHGVIHLCHATMMLPQATLPVILKFCLHELGHMLANTAGHLDPSEHAIMSPSINDSPGVQSFKPADRDYACSTRNAIHGFCN